MTLSNHLRPILQSSSGDCIPLLYITPHACERFHTHGNDVPRILQERLSCHAVKRGKAAKVIACLLFALRCTRAGRWTTTSNCIHVKQLGCMCLSLLYYAAHMQKRGQLQVFNPPTQRKRVCVCVSPSHYAAHTFASTSDLSVIERNVSCVMISSLHTHTHTLTRSRICKHPRAHTHMRARKHAHTFHSYGPHDFKFKEIVVFDTDFAFASLSLALYSLPFLVQGVNGFWITQAVQKNRAPESSIALRTYSFLVLFFVYYIDTAAVQDSYVNNCFERLLSFFPFS